MAKKQTTKEIEDKNVTRITASSANKKSKKSDTKDAKLTVKTSKVERKKASKKPKEYKPTKNPFVMLGRYFRDSWRELRQVRWPNTKTTISMTIAVLIFTGIITLFIVGLDIAFKALFEQILQ